MPPEQPPRDSESSERIEQTPETILQELRDISRGWQEPAGRERDENALRRRESNVVDAIEQVLSGGELSEENKLELKDTLNVFYHHADDDDVARRVHKLLRQLRGDLGKEF